ncbi:tRNA (guanosine(46)-N7)-methyltransferase TrmB [Ureaplasma parvum]|uniref:tRNA (guanine-N(7)-)-methyltransferase n=1 Tax=Ureaplasma parvum TaxID=134821 RepID=A0AAC9T388_UREPR|nr:tRNA (guanosine(46)-N7)-methyltransferase TrmB [Ureaplasma parvum]ASD29950.1 tRNA (guanosine(46)-N7)-methyltransferase TrmB [Ureaplasma parvum]
MRLRNNANAPLYLKSQHEYIINDPHLLKDNLGKIFKNPELPIYIEIGMGKGDFIIENALRNQQINYLGIEKFPTVIVKAHKKALKHKLDNLAMICFDANKILELLNSESVDKIYLNFSDPWPKKRHAKKRLTHPCFLEKFAVILKQNALVEFKTDNENLFMYTIYDVLLKDLTKYEILFLTYNLYTLVNNVELLKNIPTEYEKKFVMQGERIKKVNFRFLKNNQ